MFLSFLPLGCTILCIIVPKTSAKLVSEVFVML